MKACCNTRTSVEVTERRLNLRRMRWQLASGRVPCDPDLLPEVLECLDGEIAELEGR